jgi:nucleosome binding factor SPN SPT16 subunit
MIFQVSIGFSDLVNVDAKEAEAKKYALFLGDTVQVKKVSKFKSILKSNNITTVASYGCFN